MPQARLKATKKFPIYIGCGPLNIVTEKMTVGSNIIVLKAANEIANEFYDWLRNSHLNKMLEFKGFTRAELLVLDKEDFEHKYYTCRYYVDSHESLQDYFENHSKITRQEGLDKFGDKFSAERQVFTLDSTFEKK